MTVISENSQQMSEGLSFFTATVKLMISTNITEAGEGLDYIETEYYGRLVPTNTSNHLVKPPCVRASP